MSLGRASLTALGNEADVMRRCQDWQHWPSTGRAWRSTWPFGMGRDLTHQDNQPAASTINRFISATAPSSDNQGLHVALPARVYGLSFAMAIFSTVLPVFMLSTGIRLIGSGRTALVGSVGPVATIFMAHLMLGETICGQQIVGSALVLAGVLAISVKRGGGVKR